MRQPSEYPTGEGIGPAANRGELILDYYMDVRRNRRDERRVDRGREGGDLGGRRCRPGGGEE